MEKTEKFQVFDQRWERRMWFTTLMLKEKEQVLYSVIYCEPQELRYGQ